MRNTNHTAKKEKVTQLERLRRRKKSRREKNKRKRKKLEEKRIEPREVPTGRIVTIIRALRLPPSERGTLSERKISELDKICC